MVDSDLRRLWESLGEIAASLNALKAEMDLLSQHQPPPAGKPGPGPGEFLAGAEGGRPSIGTPVDEAWLPLSWLQDAPILPSFGVEIGGLLEPVFERLSGVARVDRFILFLWNDEERRLIPRASRGFRRDDLEDFSLGIKEGITGRAFHEGRPIAASGAGQGTDPLVSRFPVREAIALPIRSTANVVGALYAGRIYPTPFEARDLALLTILADRIGTWLHAAALFDQMHHQVDRLKELVRLSLKVTSSLDLAESFTTAAEVAARLLRVQSAAIALTDPAGALTIQAGVGLPAGLQAEWRGRRGDGLVGRVVRGGQPFVAADLLASASPALPFGPEFPVRGLILLPLKVRDETFGCLILADPLPRVFSPEEVEAVTLLATQAALAIENARLYGETWRAYEELKAAQEQLIQSEKARALGEMAGGIAHDFNNILAIVLGKTQLMLERVQDAAIRDGLEVIEEAAWRGAETVRRLQGFAATRGEEGFVGVDLNAIILDGVGATRPRWKDEGEAQGLRVEVVTDLGELPPILGNSIELREMVVNLIFNALDAMPEGGRITIKSRPAGDMVEMSLSDTGVGMPEEVRRRIFDPFFTTKGPRGSGLGLAVVHGILARHRGQVEVSSGERRGTTFVIRFPVASGAPLPPPSHPVTGIAQPARILVIEDEIPLRAMLVEILMSAGHTVRWAVDGLEGLALFQRETFDVVFTDLSMPEVSGWDVARAVKKMNPRVPVILVTGWGDQLDSQQLRESGVDLVVAKPFRVERVLLALTDALALRNFLER